MNLNATIDLYFGGSGSGCDPAVAEANGTQCGRPKGQGKGELANWKRQGRSVGGHQNEFIAQINGRTARILKIKDQTVRTVDGRQVFEVKGKHWALFVDGVQTAFTFPNSLAARKAINKDPDKYVRKAAPALQPVREQSIANDPISAPRLGPQSQIEIENTLVTGQPVQMTYLGGGMMETDKVEFSNGAIAIWKPSRGEKHISDKYPTGEYYVREAVAYDTAKILGLGHLVPPTVSRDLKPWSRKPDEGVMRKVNYPDGYGSLQAFIPNAQTWSEIQNNPPFGSFAEFSFMKKNVGIETMKEVAMFDSVIGNFDRHGGNFMFTKNGDKYDLHLIDHGLTFGSHRAPPTNSQFNAILDNMGETEIPDVLIKKWESKWPELERSWRKNGIHTDYAIAARKRFDAIKARRAFRFSFDQESF